MYNVDACIMITFYDCMGSQGRSNAEIMEHVEAYGKPSEKTL